MPILFRCEHCQQKLSVTSRKAGTTLKCPKCEQKVMVPIPEAKLVVEEEDDAEDEELDLDLDEETGPEEKGEPSQLPPTREMPTAAPQDDAQREEKAWAPTREVPEKRQEAVQETAPVPTSAAPLVRSEKKPNEFPRPAPAQQSKQDEEEFELRGARSELEEMDLTPMVDVTFLLLIFFMITASFSLTKTIETPAPDPDEKGAQTMTLEELEKTSITVIIDAEDNIFIKDDDVYDDTPIDPVDLEDILGDKLRDELKNELIIQSSPLARHETFVNVFDSATGAGMQKIRLASSQSEE